LYLRRPNEQVIDTYKLFSMYKIKLKPKKDAFVRRFHPWIFSGAIQAIDGTPEDGDVVRVLSAKGEPLATGHYQAGSIAVRLFAFEEVEPDQKFWTSKLMKAFALRQKLGLTVSETTNCYRLVHAAGDGLPGLIIDMYGGTAVLQCHSIGMYREREHLVAALRELYGEQLKAVFDKSAETLPRNFAADVQEGYLFGKSEPQEVLENGHRFWVNWEAGQKTGFFLDQRENRQLLTRYVQDKQVLNTFCYSGGFSVYALAAGAKSVQSVDLSRQAIEWTDKNVRLNAPDAKHESYAEDVLQFLKRLETPAEVMVVDPPAFAKNVRKRHNAVQGYKRLNALAMQKLAPEGILFTFSCSKVVDAQLFENTMLAAALEVGRSVRVLHRLSQPPDHPVSIYHAESTYLKGLVLFVD